MAMRKPQTRKLQFEFMEPREVLSGSAGGAAAIALQAPQTSSVPFRLIGSGISSGQMSLPDGQPAMLNVAWGHAVILGQFKGQILVPSSEGDIPPTVFAYFYGENGTTLRMTIKLTGVGGNGDDGPTVIHGRYYITGGAGRLQGASGTGSIIATPSRDSNAFTFGMQGQITV
jgi:hypothetical protein